MKQILVASALILVVYGSMFGVANAGVDVIIGVPPVVIAPPVVIEQGPYFAYEPRGPYGYWGGGEYEGRHYERGHYGSDYRERHDNGFRDNDFKGKHNHGHEKD
jgi:hypothetical protein